MKTDGVMALTYDRSKYRVTRRINVGNDDMTIYTDKLSIKYVIYI